MKTQHQTKAKTILAAAVAAVGATPQAGDAALYTATLQQVLTYSNNGTAGSAGNITSSTATWTYDDVANVVSQTGGTFNVRFTTAPTSTLFRTSIQGLVLGNGAPATATSYVCTEGNFGGGVGASICGNYSFGANFTNESTTSWGPGTSVARTLGGDDAALGAQQSIATLNTMTTTSFDSTPVTGTLVITNKTCTGPCATLPSGAFNNGQQWTLGNFVLVVQGPVDDTADAESGQQVSIDVLANDAGYADPVTVTIDTPPDQGGTATVTNSPGAASAIRINYTSAANFSGTETFVYRAVSGALDDTGTVTVTVEDTVPTAITFTSQTGVALSTQVTSATANVAGISTAVPISVTNGEYSVDGGAFTSTAGTVQNNQTVALRHTSSATPATDTVTTVTIGGFSTVQGTFTSTTVPADTIPDAFSFTAVTNATTSTAYTSNAITVAGINAPAAITVTGGQYSVNSGAFTAAAGTVSNGDTVAVRQTSSASASTATTATVTIGGVDGVYSVTTGAVAADTTPDQFTFTDQENVDRDTVITSAPVTIAGINAAAAISVANGEYSIDGGAFTSTAGTVTNGQEVAVRHTSSANSGSVVTTTLTVGGVSDAFSSSTPRSGGSSSADGLMLGLLGLLGLARGRKKTS
ncbi:MAG: hypothetical protein J0M16_05735 [Gammaproteobacteria bacterium]|nr:hypothetical protein [Gammaproteobacteria bacterium]